MLKVIAVAGWVGVVGSLGLGGCSKDEPLPAGVTAGAALGGIDFQRYCFATGGGTAVVRGDWVCEKTDGTSRPADANEACRQQYPGASPHAEVAKYGDPLSWTCYAAVPGELGGLNLDAYCKSIGAKSAFVHADKAEWRCAREGDSALIIDMNAACKHGYPNEPGATARQLRPGNLTSWVCLRR